MVRFPRNAMSVTVYLLSLAGAGDPYRPVPPRTLRRRTMQHDRSESVNSAAATSLRLCVVGTSRMNLLLSAATGFYGGSENRVYKNPSPVSPAWTDRPRCQILFTPHDLRPGGWRIHPSRDRTLRATPQIEARKTGARAPPRGRSLVENGAVGASFSRRRRRRVFTRRTLPSLCRSAFYSPDR
jgi:hypothetical protein